MIAITSRSLRGFSEKARKILRPMRPKPLIAIFVVISASIDFNKLALTLTICSESQLQIARMQRMAVSFIEVLRAYRARHANYPPTDTALYAKCSESCQSYAACTGWLGADIASAAMSVQQLPHGRGNICHTA